MRKKAILITGAAGEIGHALIEALAQESTGETEILTLDLQPMPEEFSKISTHLQGDILDEALLARLISEYEFEVIYHMAALLSTRSEFTPNMAHKVNVEGTRGLLQMAAEQSEWRGKAVKFIFPSSIAVYGLPDLETKNQYARVREWEWNYPRTMYGANKLYCELLGVYFSQYYRQLATDQATKLDFRAVRFPGLISAFTAPSGGTSDYGPEMLHAAAQGKPYHCFVRPDVRISFMAMPDAVTALLKLAAAPVEQLGQRIYNVTSFSLSAEEFRAWVLKFFPEAEIDYQPDLKRQTIVDSWAADMDDSAACRDWDWEPAYGVERAFAEYLVPNIQKRYEGEKA
ncbi:MAG: NAD-dependent epimerase/dehydratase family protein [Anaerolineales bacterium]|nr:NAD-dependent epimerase/dehydratase family protein [Anaerolineales bacterium]